jgi:DNA polymerase-3 subunit beta
VKLTIVQPNLKRLLASVVRAADRRSSMPALSHVLLEASEADGIFRATATDLSTRTSAGSAARVSKSGAVCLPAKDLAGIVAALPAVDVEISVSDTHRATLKAGKVEYKLAGLGAEDFPKAPTAPGDGLVVDAHTLAELLGFVMPAVSSDETRYHLCGVYLKGDGKKLTAVSTDGHRLHLATGECPLEAPGVIVPKRGADELRRLLEKAASARVSLSPKAISAEVEGVSLSVQLVDAQFPDYEQVIPKEEKSRAEVSREGLLAAVKRARLCTKGGLKVAFDVGQVTVTGEDLDLGEAREEVEHCLTGDPVTMGLSAEYLAGALGALDGEEVTVGLSAPESPVVLRAGGALAVIMPMRL